MRTTALIFATVALAGCSSIPKGFPAQPVTVQDVVAALHCELASVYGGEQRQKAFFDGWAAGAELNLVLDNTSSATPGLTLKPAVPEGKLTLPGSATFSDTAKRDFKFRDFVSMRALDPETPSGAAVAAGCPVVSAHGQDMGLGAALRDLVAADARDDVGKIQIEKTSMVITFKTTRTLDGGLSFESATFTASLSSTKATRTLENKITITFERDDAPVAMASSVQPGSEAVSRLNDSLDALTVDRGIQLQRGDTLVVQ